MPSVSPKRSKTKDSSIGPSKNSKDDHDTVESIENAAKSLMKAIENEKKNKRKITDEYITKLKQLEKAQNTLQTKLDESQSKLKNVTERGEQEQVKAVNSAKECADLRTTVMKMATEKDKMKTDFADEMKMIKLAHETSLKKEKKNYEKQKALLEAEIVELQRSHNETSQRLKRTEEKLDLKNADHLAEKSELTKSLNEALAAVKEFSNHEVQRNSFYVRSLNKAKAEKLADKERFEKTILALEKKVTDNNGKVKLLEAQKFCFEKELIEMKENFDKIQNEQALWKEKEAKLIDAVNEANRKAADTTQYDSLKNLLNEAENKNNGLVAEKGDLETNINDLKKKLDTADAEQLRWEKTELELRQNFEDAKRKTADMMELIEKLNKEVMEKKGAIVNFYKIFLHQKAALSQIVVHEVKKLIIPFIVFRNEKMLEMEKFITQNPGAFTEHEKQKYVALKTENSKFDDYQEVLTNPRYLLWSKTVSTTLTTSISLLQTMFTTCFEFIFPHLINATLQLSNDPGKLFDAHPQQPAEAIAQSWLKLSNVIQAILVLIINVTADLDLNLLNNVNECFIQFFRSTNFKTPNLPKTKNVVVDVVTNICATLCWMKPLYNCLRKSSNCRYRFQCCCRLLFFEPTKKMTTNAFVNNVQKALRTSTYFFKTLIDYVEGDEESSD